MQVPSAEASRTSWISRGRLLQLLWTWWFQVFCTFQRILLPNFFWGGKGGRVEVRFMGLCGTGRWDSEKVRKDGQRKPHWFFWGMDWSEVYVFRCWQEDASHDKRCREVFRNKVRVFFPFGGEGGPLDQSMVLETWLAVVVVPCCCHATSEVRRDWAKSGCKCPWGAQVVDGGTNGILHSVGEWLWLPQI